MDDDNDYNDEHYQCIATANPGSQDQNLPRTNPKHKDKKKLKPLITRTPLAKNKP